MENNEKTDKAQRVIIVRLEESKDKPKLWNSLELSKMAVFPLLLALLSIGYQSCQKGLDEQAAIEQELVKRRAETWNQMAPLLNDVYCYLMFVGGWKEFTVATMLKDKRTLDRSFYSNRIYFHDEFAAAYKRFMDEVAFKPYTGMGQDAQLRTTNANRPPDETAKPESFDRDYKTSDREGIHTAYWALQEAAANELKQKIGRTPPTPKIP